MATATELNKSRTYRNGKNAQGKRLYRVTGASSESAAVSAVEAACPDTWDDLVYDCTDLQDEAIAGNYQATANYVLPERVQQAVGDPPKISFSTGGGTKHITQAISNVSNYAPAGKTAPDHKGAINVQADGTVQGLDIDCPKFEWSETHVLASGTVNDLYIAQLAALTGCTNNATFRGFMAGEVLFLGAEGTRRSDGAWEITFKFSQSPTGANLAIGDITVTVKAGWDYLWIEYEEVKDDTANPPRMVSRPLAAHVEKVFETGAFSGLGIG